jgi:hypothetical protein
MNNYKNYYKHLLKEGMSIYLADTDHDEKRLQTVLGISFKYTDLVLRPVVSKMTPEESAFFEKHRLPDVLTSDGDDYDKPTGILNFYPSGLNDKDISTILNSIKYHAADIGLEIGTIKGPELSGLSKWSTKKIYVYRIPIVKNNNVNSKPAPELHYSNSNARIIFSTVLQLPQYDSSGFSVPTFDLLNRVTKAIQKTEQDDEYLYRHARKTTDVTGAGGARVIDMGLSPEDILHRLYELKNLCEYAQEKECGEIVIS